MPKSSITVIVPVYNRATTVIPTLESIAAQTLPPERLVVVDDGSRDGSADSALRWIAGRQLTFETQVVSKPNGGVSSARNCAVALCGESPWFAFLDSDDIWPADFLARAQAALTAPSPPGKPAAVAASADRLFVEQSTGEERRFDMHELAAAPALWMLRRGAAISSCSVVRADLIRELGGFPEHLVTAEDAAVYLPLSLRGSWLHLPGEPVQFIRSAPAPGAEEASLSRKFTDNHRRWARVFEAFFAGLSRQEQQQIGSRKRIRRYLADRWTRAAQELERHGHILEAAACSARALAWKPNRLDRWQALLGTPWKAAFGPARRAA